MPSRLRMRRRNHAGGSGSADPGELKLRGMVICLLREWIRGNRRLDGHRSSCRSAPGNMPRMIKAMLGNWKSRWTVSRSINWSTVAEATRAMLPVRLRSLFCSTLSRHWKVISTRSSGDCRGDSQADVSQGTYEISVVLTRIFRGGLYALLGKTRRRASIHHKPWFEMARQFTDEWDQISFPILTYDTLPLHISNQ